MAHMQKQGDLANVEGHQESALPLKTLKRSSSVNLSTDECAQKRRAVNKEVQCNDVHDKGNEFSNELVCQPATPEDKGPASESNNSISRKDKVAHLRRQGDFADAKEHKESNVLTLKKLKRSSPDKLSTDKATLECAQKRNMVNKGVQCSAVQDEGDEFSKGLVCHPAKPEDEAQSNNESNKYIEESIQSQDYWNSSMHVNDEIADRLVTVPEFTFDPILLRRDLAKMIILHEYPLSMVDHLGFRDFLHKLNPLFRMVSKTTVENDIKKLFKFERCIAYSELSGCNPGTQGRVAITTKMWTSSNGNRRFLAITGHMIDGEGKRQSYIMRFAHVPLPCKNETIIKILLDCFTDFRVEKKLSIITVDSYTSDDKLSEILVDKLSENKFLFGGKLPRLPCFARTVSLMVQDGFDVIWHVIEKIRTSILFWTSSPKREKAFQKAACQLGLDSAAKLVLDCGLSWKSTYLMLQQSFLFKDVFSHMSQQESCPSKEEWDLAMEVSTRLQLLYDKMLILGETPSCLYFPHLCEIKLNISNWLNSEVPEIKEMASQMTEKFDKYWLVAGDIFGLATAFHPKLRFFPLKFYLPKIYGNETEAEAEIERIRQIFYDLFREYKSSLPIDESDDENLPSLLPWMRSFSMYVKEMKKKEPELQEADSYFEGSQGRHTEDSEIYTWWTNHEKIFPVLHKMAKDILAIPIFSVDAENAFDVGDSILGANRSRLHPTMIETLMCTQRWVTNRIHSGDAVSSSGTSATNLHALGTIFDDANVDRGVSLKVEP